MFYCMFYFTCDRSFRYDISDAERVLAMNSRITAKLDNYCIEVIYISVNWNL